MTTTAMLIQNTDSRNRKLNLFFLIRKMISYSLIIPVCVFSYCSCSVEQTDNATDTDLNLPDSVSRANLTDTNYSISELLSIHENGDMPWFESIRFYTDLSKKHFDIEEFDRAIEYCFRALRISDQSRLVSKTPDDSILWNHLSGKAEAQIGDIYYKIQQHRVAINYYDQAIRHFSLINDTASLLPAMNSLAISYYYYGDDSTAIKHFNDLIHIASLYNDSCAIANAYNNLGLIEHDNANFQKAYEYFTNAGVLYHTCGNIRKKATTLFNIGLLQGPLGCYDSTVVYYQKAISLLEEINDLSGVIRVQIALAQFYFTKREFDDSEKFLIGALKNAKIINAKNFIIEIYGCLAKLKEESRQYKEAYNFLKLHKLLHDSIFQQNVEKIVTLQRQYEDEKSKKEIEILSKNNEIKDLQIQKQRTRLLYLFQLAIIATIALVVLIGRYRFKIRTNKELSLQKEQLEAANAAKNKFFSIIAHDLKNAVYATQSMADVLYNDFNKLSKAQYEKIIGSIYHSSIHTTQLMENLLLWAMSQTGKIKLIPQKCLLGELIDNEVFIASEEIEKKKIHIQKNIPEGLNAFADINITAFIIRNLLSNAIKFTAENGQISFTISNKKDVVSIAVEDNGIGILHEDLPKLFRMDINTSVIQSSGNKGTGLGLILCRDFIEKSGGNIWAESTAGKGSIFTFTLKKWID